MRLAYNRRSTSIGACFFIAVALVGLMAARSILIDHHLMFWVGGGTAGVFVGLLGGQSYYNTRQRLTDKDIANVAKTMNSPALSRRTFWPWLVVTAVLIIYLSQGEHAFLYGVGVGLFFFIGLMVIIDNLLLRRIFTWNINDPRIKKYKNRAAS